MQTETHFWNIETQRKIGRALVRMKRIIHLCRHREVLLGLSSLALWVILGKYISGKVSLWPLAYWSTTWGSLDTHTMKSFQGLAFCDSKYQLVSPPYQCQDFKTDLQRKITFQNLSYCKIMKAAKEFNSESWVLTTGSDSKKKLLWNSDANREHTSEGQK